MAIDILFNKTLVQIDSLTLDASLSEQHTRKVTLTKHPVEQGAAITDHMVLEPDTVTIEGLVTNSPIPDENATPIEQTYTDHTGRPWTIRSAAQRDPKRAGNAYQELRGFLESGQLLTIHTALHEYTSMKMSSLDVPRNAESGQALRFTATFEQIRVVTNATALIQASTRRAQPVQDLSKKNTTPDNRTALKKLLTTKPGEVPKPVTTVIYNNIKDTLFGN